MPEPADFSVEEITGHGLMSEEAIKKLAAYARAINWLLEEVRALKAAAGTATSESGVDTVPIVATVLDDDTGELEARIVSAGGTVGDVYTG